MPAAGASSTSQLSGTGSSAPGAARTDSTSVSSPASAGDHRAGRRARPVAEALVEGSTVEPGCGSGEPLGASRLSQGESVIRTMIRAARGVETTRPPASKDSTRAGAETSGVGSATS